MKTKNVVLVLDKSEKEILLRALSALKSKDCGAHVTRLSESQKSILADRINSLSSQIEDIDFGGAQ